MSDTIVRFKKKDGQLVPYSFSDAISLKQLIDSIPEETVCIASYEIESDKGSKLQITRIHAMIRELSEFTGSTFEEMKDIVKNEAGLNKSFTEYSSKELNYIIQNTIKLGADIGYFFRS